METKQTEKHTRDILTLDAKGKRLGRLATKAAMALMGKDKPTYVANKQTDIEVRIENASKLLIQEKKKEQKIYTHYTGYPGGLRKRSMDYVMEKKGYSELVRNAVYGMLPNNKLRAGRMKRLIVSE